MQISSTLTMKIQYFITCLQKFRHCLLHFLELLSSYWRGSLKCFILREHILGFLLFLFYNCVSYIFLFIILKSTLKIYIKVFQNLSLGLFLLNLSELSRLFYSFPSLTLRFLYYMRTYSLYSRILEVAAGRGGAHLESLHSGG